MNTSRTNKQITKTVDELIEKTWYGAYLYVKDGMQTGKIQIEDLNNNGDYTIQKNVWDDAPFVAAALEQKYGKSNLITEGYFDRGVLYGKLSALLWVMGYEWDSYEIDFNGMRITLFDNSTENTK